MNKIIKIQPVPKYFTITWMLGAHCNYDCMYCPSELHDQSGHAHNLETMQQAWKNIHTKAKQQGLFFKITFTGGEVTANKNFLSLLQWIRKNYSDVVQIGFTTNGSASLNYYTKLVEFVESISFSTHSEFMDEQAFFDKVINIDKLMIKPKKSLHVNIMNEYWNQDRIKLYQQLLDKHRISHCINEIDYSVKIREEILNKGKLNLDTI
jgi:MoaA/NifB/PqqE/SkfB family radical SAM enzyme